jgi:predicted nucleic acid-binding protein
VVWYVDTSAFLKLLVTEEGSAALRSWYTSQDALWSSHLLRTEALRAAARLGIEETVVEEALDTVSLVLPSVTTFATAGRIQPRDLRSLDTLHLATALEIGEDLEGVVTYDERMISAASVADINVVTPL